MPIRATTPARAPPRTADVTVVIPTFNHAHYIAKALASVLEQTRPPTEVIVVDDGSTDNTAAVVAGFAKRGPVRYIRQANAGASVARNRGIHEARGHYVAFLDSDDWWLPEKLARQLAVFQAEPDVGMVTCPARIEGDRAGSTLPAEFPSGDVFLELLCRGNVLGGSASSAVIRRDCFATSGDFDPRFRVAQDWDLWMRVARHFPVRVVPEALAVYRVVAGSNSMSQRVELMEGDIRTVLGELFADPSLPARARVVRREVYAHHLVVTAKSYLGQRKIRKGMRTLGGILWRWPWRTLHAWRHSRADTARLDPALLRKAMRAGA